MNLVDILDEHALEREAEFALWDHDDGIDFGDLDLATRFVAAMFRDAGLRGGDQTTMGDVVLILQPVSITLYTVLLAVFRERLTAMFVDPGAGRSAIEEACRIIPPRAMVGNTKACLYRLVSPVLRRIPIAYTTGSIPGIGLMSKESSARFATLQLGRASSPCSIR